MNADLRLRDLLPSLYRPMPEDDTLLARLLDAAGFTLDTASEQLQHVLRAHWFDIADQALWDAHYQTARRERGLAAANIRDPKDVKELLQYPYVADLSRLCALLALPPWREPASLRETVEEYRDRVQDMLAAYRLGLTTRPALRRLVEAALPEDMSAPKAQQRWPFAIEEPVALKRVCVQITVPEAKEGDLLSPLYFWETGSAAGTPTIYFQGVAPEGDQVGATDQPVIERYTPGSTPAGIALAYRGTLLPGQALRLAPARRHWLIVDGALRVSVAETIANGGADPSVNGPWQAVANAPAGLVRAVAEAVDHSLWLVVEEGGAWILYRYDGAQFSAVTQGAPAGPYRALLPHGDALYLATDQGLYRVALFPIENQPRALAPVPSVPESAHALAILPDGRLACAGDNGLALLSPDDTLHSRLLPGLPLRAICLRDTRLYVATLQALLLQAGGHWFCYEGAGLSENRADWVPVDPAGIPAANSPLPPIRTMAATADGSLWLGTTRGLARYYAATARDLEGYLESDQAYTTLLEAFGDFGDGPVQALDVDERGLLWVMGADGLLRYDGRDFAHYDFAEARWHPLGLAAALYPEENAEGPRGHWRYDTPQHQWLRYEPEQGRYAAKPLPRRTASGAALTAGLLTASLRAELGQFDGAAFRNPQPVALAQFQMRIKPDETRLVDGGLPALPPPCPGARWRYLQLETPSLSPPPGGRPWWSREGRLFVPPTEWGRLPGHFRPGASLWDVDGRYAEALFAYPPSVRLWMEYALAPVLGVRVRLFRRAPEENVDPALIERVWGLLVRAKAAGVPLQLAVEGMIVKGESL